MENILIYTRPWNSEQFQDIARLTWPEHKLGRVSEHKGFDDVGFRNSFYSEFAKSKLDPKLTELVPFNNDEISDIILRCRLLRAVDYNFAMRLLYAASRAIDQCLEYFEPQYVLSVTVDSYIIDVLARLAGRKSIRFIGLVPTFVDGYFRITERGEKDISREVSAQEVGEVLEMLTNRAYKPQWLASNKTLIRKKAIRLWARNLIKPAWFAFYSRLKRDPLNAHYMTTDIVSRRYLSLFPRLYNETDDLGTIRSRLTADSRKAIFLPLQMSPEATIDYWSSDRSWIDYEEKVLSVVNSYSDRYLFLVKEHPNVFGFRTSDFYNKLRNAENVVLVNPEVSSNELIEACDAVLVCTGTVGFEALLRSKPVISSSDPFYANNNHFFGLGDDLTNTADCDPHDLVRYLISGFLPGTFINDGSWNQELHSGAPFNSLVSRSLSSYLSNVASGSSLG